MALGAGTRMGPYEVVGSLGAGGMGEVYRARDTRLGREVALKVLAAEVAADPAQGPLWTQRLEREARAASALNHPNIVTVYDIGTEQGRLYLVTEVIEGESLRRWIERGPLGSRKLLDIAVQIADGLAAAHAIGISHRDLKPENVMVTGEGRVKILDFGLAKQSGPAALAGKTVSVAAAGRTEPGTILGTVAYMSPEQARGAEADYRSDQFSFGLLLYEMATGKRPFERPTSVQTLSAILSEEAEPVGTAAPAPLRWIVERCLAKEPGDRYAATSDLHRDLRSLRDHLSEALQTGSSPAVTAPPVKKSKWIPAVAAVVALVIAAAGAAFWAGRNFGMSAPPVFSALTFRQGRIEAARFAPDGSVVYGAAWGGDPIQIYTTRPGRPESTPVGPEATNLLSISPQGEIAASLRHRFVGGFLFNGTLARFPLGGGAPREVLEDVRGADWGPDGATFAVLRDEAGKMRLEYPAGKTIYETDGWISHARVSPKGDRVAFLDHPVRNDDRGAAAVADLAGKKTMLSGVLLSVQGLAWHPSGAEVWFTGSREGSYRALYAATLSGKERLIAREPGTMTLQDISRQGQVLITRETPRMTILASGAGDTRERELSWLDWSLLRDMSNDGKLIMFDETGEGGGPRQGVYIRKTDGSPAVRLGDGTGRAFSPDGKWVVAAQNSLVLLPVGAGEPRAVNAPDGFRFLGGSLLPDGKRLLVTASEKERGARLFVLDWNGTAVTSPPRPVSPEGLGIGSYVAVSPDGKLIAATDSNLNPMLLAAEGSEARPLPGGQRGDLPVKWASAHEVYVFQRDSGRVFRIDTTSGRRQFWKQLAPPDRSGLISMISLRITPDGQSYAYSLYITTSELYVVEGWR